MHYRGSRRREKGVERLHNKIMAGNFCNLGKRKRHPDPGISGCSKRGKSKETYNKHSIIKLSRVNDKERILKAQEKNNLLPTVPR